jgi:uncharacterized membrane-anchored protein
MKHSKRGKPFQQSYSFEFYLTSDYYCNKKTIMKSTEIRLILCLFLTHLFIPYTVWSQNPELRVLQFQQNGKAVLVGGKAEFSIPSGFKYLDSKQSSYVLQQLWGNPPGNSFGMIFPGYANDTFPSTWAIEISYSDEGHIDDEDASEIDYEELLEQMKEAAVNEGESRKKAGFPAYEIVGWASPPFYDSRHKKLHWAKLLNFEGDSSPTLNYNIRVLGRNGVLVLNAIGSPSDLSEINQSLSGILKGINFTPGNAYADFQEGIDKKASYGIAGLIAGGILAKTGILAKMGLFFAKFAKLIFVGMAAGAGALWKLFTGRKSAKKEEEPALPVPADGHHPNEPETEDPEKGIS